MKDNETKITEAQFLEIVKYARDKRPKEPKEPIYLCAKIPCENCPYTSQCHDSSVSPIFAFNILTNKERIETWQTLK